MKNIGYIPVYNYVVKIEILDNIPSPLLWYINPKFSIYNTKNFKVIDIINYLDDSSLEKISYEIDEFNYYMYKHLQFKNVKLQNYHPAQKSYELNKIYNDHRYYYNTFDRAINENFIEYKLYTKYQEGYSGTHISYHDNGQIKEKYFHNNGIKEGLYQLFYSSGGVEKEINYINGLKHGELKKYNGIYLDVLENYNMDKLHGLCIYNNHGRLSKSYKVEITYKDGIIEGTYKKYYPYKLGGNLQIDKLGGNLQIECNFKDGKYFGLYKEYDMNNNLLIELDYKIYNKNVDITDIE
jgi:antitoxin component YwqK of YwqJK toxin-antitoxin module